MFFPGGSLQRARPWMFLTPLLAILGQVVAEPSFAKPYPGIPARSTHITAGPLSFLQRRRVRDSDGHANETRSLSERMHAWADEVVDRHRSMGCDELARHPGPVSLASANFSRFGGKAHITGLPTYYIGLDSDEDRRWLARFSELSSDFHVVDGVRGNDPEAVERCVTEPYRDLFTQQLRGKPGVIGCTLSHLRAIRAAYDAGNEVALILESDALPDLAPWWRQSLEEYVRELPAGWQASQLAWTSEPGQAKYKYEGSDSESYISLPSYGTVAYVIHRRGMERILEPLWDEEAKKFDVSDLRRSCPHFTSDDCLLSFSPYQGSRGPLLDVAHIYEAVPPMFTSVARRGDVQTQDKQWVTASFCDDIAAAVDFSSARHGVD